MEKKCAQDGIELYFPPEEKETAVLIEDACRRSVALIQETWGFSPPRRCRIYVTTSGFRFMFQSAPRLTWIASLLWVSFLLVLAYKWAFFGFVIVFSFFSAIFRFRKQWKFLAGLTLCYKNNPAIAIKPPRALARTDRTIGEMIYIKEPDANKKMEHVVCHELTHAFSASLKLPMWLNEGIAMLVVDKLFGRPTVRPETLKTLNSSRYRKSMGTYEKLPSMSKKVVAYHYVRGYWLTRFLEEAHPALLRELLAKEHPHRFFVKRIATILGMKRRLFWKTIDEKVIEHFQGKPLSEEISSSECQRSAVLEPK